MDTVREVLCRAALVRSLTQIDGVDLVMICVDGTPLTNKKGNTYGYQQAEDFVQNTGSSIKLFPGDEAYAVLCRFIWRRAAKGRG